MPDESEDRIGYEAVTYEALDQAWIDIQLSTFTNWINQSLGKVDRHIDNLGSDFCDGVNLVRLVEVLQGRKLGRICTKPINQHQNLENLQIALNALAQDNVRLVNIGAEDILKSNLKLIMGLIWRLITKYQMGKTSRMPPKKLMLAWLRAVLPEANINNFSTDWNDGRLLLGLLNFCRPGLCPVWNELDASQGLENCQRALRLAEDIFDIPPILSAEDLNRPMLDELSCLTYLSYFMNLESPGYLATKDWVNSKLSKEKPVNDFTDSWRDGVVMCDLVTAVGGKVHGWPDHLPSSSLERIQEAVNATKDLGVDPLFTPRDMLHRELDHLTVMSFCAQLHKVASRNPQAVKKADSIRNGQITSPPPKSLVIEDGITRHEEREEFKEVRQTELQKSRSRSPPKILPKKRDSLRYSGELVVLTTNCKVNEEVHIRATLESSLPDKSCLSGRIVNPSGRSHAHPIHTSWLSDNLALLHFTPTEIGEHVVAVEVQGRPPLRNSPAYVPIRADPEAVRVSLSAEQWTVGRPEEVGIDARRAGPGNVSAELRSPGSGQRLALPLNEVAGSPGRYWVKTAADEPGMWELFVSHGGDPLPDSPFPIYVSTDPLDTSRSSTGSGFVMEIPPEEELSPHHTSGAQHSRESPYTTELPPVDLWVTSEVRSGRLCTLNADLAGVPPGETVTAVVTRVTLSGDSICEVPCAVGLRSARDRQEIRFEPDVPGEYKVQVFLSGTELPGSPLYLRVPPLDSDNRVTALDHTSQPIHCSGDCLASGRAAAHKVASFIIHGENHRTRNATVKITGPNGRQTDHTMRHEQKECAVDFTPTVTGEYRIDVENANKPVVGSPFSIHVFDPTKVRVKAERQIRVGEETQIHIDCREAGRAALDLQVIPPRSRNSVHNDEEENVRLHTVEIDPTGRHVFAYLPSQPGNYTVEVRYGGQRVLGCPIVQRAEGTPMPGGGSSAGAYGEGLVRALAGEEAMFSVDSKGQKGDLFVQVDGPNSIAKCDIEPEEGGTGRYRVLYIPNEVGDYVIQMKWNGSPIRGSPFNAKVVAPSTIRCISDEGIFSGRPLDLSVNVPKDVVLDCSHAGPGSLRADARGPRGTGLRCEVAPSNRKDEWVAHFTPHHEGDHQLALWWEGFELPSAPYRGYAMPPATYVDHNKVFLSGRGLKEARIKEEAEFIIDGRQAGPGRPYVTLAGVKVDINVLIAPLSGDRYRCTYTPDVPGAYLLTIMWSDRHVRGSPFKVTVLNQSDASRVVCTGEGLVRGVMGRDFKASIDTRRAGPGELTAHCAGPHKVAYCELTDHRDGTFTLKVKPQEPGRHSLQIRYNDEHAPGSPYQVRVSGAPDASRVRVYGPGIEPGLLSTFQSKFVCETRGAGAGQLTVRIKGPQGAFRVEMERESHTDRTIVCRYDPTEPGEYIIHVKWSGVHVQGSPFRARIFETKRELDAYLRANPDAVNENMQKQWKADI